MRQQEPGRSRLLARIAVRPFEAPRPFTAVTTVTMIQLDCDYGWNSVKGCLIHQDQRFLLAMKAIFPRLRSLVKVANQVSPWQGFT